MSRYFGAVGYALTRETSPGVYIDEVLERYYYGDTISNFRRTDSGDFINNSITLNTKFSILADPFAYENFYGIRYVEYMGNKWKVTNVEVQRPRLILTVGGIYNGEQA